MKNLLLLFTLSLAINCFSQNNASKQETVSWIKSRLNYNKQWEEKTYESLDVVKYDFNNDTLFYRVQYTWGKKDGGHRINAIPIKDINPERIIITRSTGDEGDLRIELYTNNGKKSIKELLKGSANDEYITLYRDKTPLYLPKAKLDMEGYNLPERIVNALKHLIKLAGGSGEKF